MRDGLFFILQKIVVNSSCGHQNIIMNTLLIKENKYILVYYRYFSMTIVSFSMLSGSNQSGKMIGHKYIFLVDFILNLVKVHNHVFIR